MARFYVTTPIYYVNDVPHLGTAYTTIIADALARHRRMRGDETHFLTGTDEHGQKIERSAADRGQTPIAFVDEMSAKFRAAFFTGGDASPLHVAPDDFIRTTETRQREVVQDLWRRCVKNGFIFEGDYEGHYCVGCETFYTEKELTQTPEGLACPTHLTVTERVKEPSYFFKLSAMQDRLLAFYERHPGFISPESRRNEVLSFVKSGLQDLSVSRTSFTWGIPVPDQPEATKNKHVMYVWFDALTNYLSALGREGDPLRRFWPADVHLVGKDILRFHAVFWPAFLLGAGYSEDQLPKKVFAHGWLTINGQKMSKSLRNVVEPLALAKAFGADTVRFYLMREIAFGQDGDFSHTQLIARYNSELADSLGNLLNRKLGLCAKLRPASEGGTIAALAPTDLEAKLEEAAKTALVASNASFAEIAPHRAVDAIWALCRAANKYIDEAAPWGEAKKGEAGKARVDTILANGLEVIRWIATMVWPVMPEVSGKILAQLGRPAIAPVLGTDLLALRWTPTWDAAALSLGTPIFPKIDADRQKEIFAELGVAEASTAPAGEAPKKDASKAKVAKPELGPAAEIAYEDFAKLDLRVGEIKAAERVAKSDKMLRLQVDVGDADGPRQVLAGIGKTFAPAALIGKQVCVVCNLKPAKLMGLESRGMILAGSGEGESDLALMHPGTPRKIGARVK
ncbi:MAG: methionine--tRNA ligase [Polyangiales bacterium]